MTQNADRYTMLQVHFNDLPEKIQAIHSLDLKWFCVKSDTASNSCDVYIFFDKAGLNNYLRGIYGSIATDQRNILSNFDGSEIAAVDIINQIAETLNY